MVAWHWIGAPPAALVPITRGGPLSFVLYYPKGTSADKGRQDRPRTRQAPFCTYTDEEFVCLFPDPYDAVVKTEVAVSFRLHDVTLRAHHVIVLHPLTPPRACVYPVQSTTTP